MHYYLGLYQKKSSAAASKARVDAELIFKKNGYKKLAVSLPDFITNSLLLYSMIELVVLTLKLLTLKKEATVVLHYPDRMMVEHEIYGLISRIKGWKKIRVVYLIHDLYGLRDANEEFLRLDFQRLAKAEAIISHNEKMTAYLVAGGLSQDKIVELQIFDYLDSDTTNQGVFGNSVIIAGELIKRKLGPLSELAKYDNIQFNLYGPKMEEAAEGYENIQYFGAFPASEIINKIQGSYGLVLDTASESMKSSAADYQKYNNPHKVSLYLAGGFPIIIWKEAALASFVEKNGVGFAIKNLEELSEKIATVTEAEYQAMRHQTQKVSQKIRSGYFLSQALQKAEQLIEEQNK